MINLKQLITEGKRVKYKFRNVLPGGVDASVDVEFKVHEYNGRLIFLPKTSNDLDKLDTLTLNREGIAIILENRINDSFKEVEIKRDNTYQGAGYGFIIDFEKLINKIK